MAHISQMQSRAGGVTLWLSLTCFRRRVNAVVILHWFPPSTNLAKYDGIQDSTDTESTLETYIISWENAITKKRNDSVLNWT